MALKLVHTSSTDPAAVSPKVSQPVWVTLLVAALTGVLGALTPDMFGPLGEFAGPTFLVVGAVINAVVGYLTKDPARTETPEPSSGPAPNEQFPAT